jgi:RND superfamily putative drug exporter
MVDRIPIAETEERFRPRPQGVLERVANLLSRTPTAWIVIAAWLLVLPFAGTLSGKLYGIENNDAISYLPRTAESTQVYSALARHSRQAPQIATLVYSRPSGITAADRDRVQADAARFQRFSGGVPVGQPIPSGDGKALMLNVPLPATTSGPRLIETVKTMRSDLHDTPAGLQASVTGPAGYAADFGGALSGLDVMILLATVGVVAVILLVTYRSPVLWLIPLLTVGMGYTVAAAIVYLMASRLGVVVSSETGGIIPVLVFGAGTDYALLLIARYREELRRHASRNVAMAAALRRALPAILASGATVSVSLLCLLVAELNSNRGLGPVGAIGIACAFLAMVTLMPAILLLCGRFVFWPFVPRPGTAEPTAGGVWGRIGRRIAARPRLVWLPAAAALGLVAAIGLGQAKFGLSQTQVFRTAPDSTVGQLQLARHFQAGASDPAVVLTRPASIATVSAAARQTAGVAQVLPASVNGDQAVVPVVLSDPPSSTSAKATVQQLRTAVHRVPGAGALVGGDTAMALDTRTSSVRDETIVMPLVLGVIFLILVALLRSLVTPLVLVATVVLSYLASLGAGTLIFQHLYGFGGIDYSVPLLGFVFLVALGVDYNIFLVTRIREEVGRRGHREGVLSGLAATGGVITSAGIVLAATFSVLAVLPLVLTAEIGILVALGVLLDTLIVRSVLVPTMALDLGRRFWWPARAPLE